MTRQTTLLIAALSFGATACHSGEGAAKQAKTDAAAAKPVPVAGGLDLGERFAAFEIINCDSGEQYCQVCKFGPSPKIMAVGTIDDAAFKDDLKQLDALVAKYGDGEVKAFAVIADAKDGALVTPIASKDELLAQAKALRTELGLTMPVVIPAAKGGAANGIFEEHYDVRQSRTIMFADGRNRVTYSEVAPSSYDALEAAIEAVVGA